MITKDAEEHLCNIKQSEIDRYNRYFDRIKPQNHEDGFRRWIFAYASVHTSWQMNCRLYRALEDLTWVGDDVKLFNSIVSCRAGMHNNRARFISEFSRFYWDHPDWFNKTKHEDWFQYRDRIQNAAPGIGQAKSAFVAELNYLPESQIICVDTHMLQLYGYSSSTVGKVTKKKMTAIEQHWMEECQQRKIPPAVGRWWYWDNKAGQADSRFWSFVFEKDNYNKKLESIAGRKGV